MYASAFKAIVEQARAAALRVALSVPAVFRWRLPSFVGWRRCVYINPASPSPPTLLLPGAGMEKGSYIMVLSFVTVARHNHVASLDTSECFPPACCRTLFSSISLSLSLSLQNPQIASGWVDLWEPPPKRSGFPFRKTNKRPHRVWQDSIWFRGTAPYAAEGTRCRK